MQNLYQPFIRFPICNLAPLQLCTHQVTVQVPTRKRPPLERNSTQARQRRIGLSWKREAKTESSNHLNYIVIALNEASTRAQSCALNKSLLTSFPEKQGSTNSMLVSWLRRRSTHQQSCGLKCGNDRRSSTISCLGFSI